MAYPFDEDGKMKVDNGAPVGTGSRPSDQAPSGLDAPRVDPSRWDRAKIGGALLNGQGGYQDCVGCGGHGFVRMVVDAVGTEQRAYCGNCAERRRAEVITEEPCDFWWVWTKHGQTPRWFHSSQESAEAEATRLAVKFPKRKFIVLHAYRKFSVTKQNAGGSVDRGDVTAVSNVTATRPHSDT